MGMVLMASMWSDKLDTSKLKEDIGIDEKINKPGYIKAKISKSKEEYLKKYKLSDRVKNDKMYIFLILDNKDNINLMQQFEINYLKHKAKDIEDALNYIESGISLKIIERQMNVKYSFIQWVLDNDLINFLKDFKGKPEEYRSKVKKGSRIIETDKLLDEYLEYKLDIIGYIRDGNTVHHTLDEVGSIYNTREWMTFMDKLEAEGYDLRGSDKLEDIIMMKLEGYSEEEIEVELGFNGTVEEESKIVFKGMNFSFDINSINDKVVKEYQEIRENIEFDAKEGEIPVTDEKSKEVIESKKGLELLEFFDVYMYFYGDFNNLFRE